MPPYSPRRLRRGSCSRTALSQTPAPSSIGDAVPIPDLILVPIPDLILVPIPGLIRVPIPGLIRVPDPTPVPGRGSDRDRNHPFSQVLGICHAADLTIAYQMVGI